MKNRSELIHILQTNSKVKLVFRKQNGAIRKMDATRRSDIIANFIGPSYNPNNRKRYIDEAHNNITVFDLVKKAFRTFKVDRLISIEIDKHDS